MSINPLTQADCDVLTTVLSRLNDQREFLARCKRCKLDTANLEKWLEEQAQVASDIKREFFPHCP